MDADWQKFCTENRSASGRMQFNKLLLKLISLIVLGYTSSFTNAVRPAVWILTQTSFHWTQVLQACTFYFDYCINHLKNHNDSVRYHNGILRSQMIFTQHLHTVYEAFITDGRCLVGSPNLQHRFSQEIKQYVIIHTLKRHIK